MIAEAPQIAQSTTLAGRPTDRPTTDRPSLALDRVVASLQVMLATRRAARNDDHAYWYTICRGM